MTENKVKNILEIKLYECPRCHIKLNKKEMNLHNIKCRKINNEIEKTTENKEYTTKDEYKLFMEKISNINMDDKNIKTLIKNFCIIFGNKIESLENNIKEINKKIKKINENNKFYFKKINDSLDKINNQSLNKKEINKNKQTDNKLHTFRNKPELKQNETDLNIFESENVQNKNKLPTPFILEKKGELKSKINNNNFYSKKVNKKKFMSEKNILKINKETITQFNKNIFDDNKKYKEIIKKEKKKENKYKVKKLKMNNYNHTTYKFNKINILTEENIINHTSNNNNLEVNIRRSLSFGDLNEIIKNNNNENRLKNDNYDDYVNNILIDSLDIIMEKISNLEESLLNLGLNDNDLKEKIFAVKSKDFEYSNSESFHSEPSGDNDK